MSDLLIETRRNLAKYLGMPERTARTRKTRLIDGGYAFFRKRRRGEKQVICAWSSSLKRYIEDCGREGLIP